MIPQDLYRKVYYCLSLFKSYKDFDLMVSFEPMKPIGYRVVVDDMILGELYKDRFISNEITYDELLALFKEFEAEILTERDNILKEIKSLGEAS